MRLSLIGPVGTVASTAASMIFPDAKLTFCEQTESTFDLVEKGQVDSAFLVLRVLKTGLIQSNIHLLKDRSFYIHDHYFFTSSLHLAGFLSPSEAKRLYVEPRAYKQCKNTLKKLKFLGEIIITKSNADSALKVQDDVEGIALTTKEAIDHYQLALIAEDVQDEKNNTFEFVITSNKKPEHELPKRSLYLLSSTKDRATVKSEIKSLTKEACLIENVVEDESEENLFLVSFDQISHVHLVDFEKLYPTLQYLGAYKL